VQSQTCQYTQHLAVLYNEVSVILPASNSLACMMRLNVSTVVGTAPRHKRWGVARVVKDRTVLPADHSSIHECYEPKLVLILPDPEGWRAEST